MGSDAHPDLTYWMVEEGTVGAGFRRVRHLKTGGYLDIGSGALGDDEVQPGWWSARWVLQ